MITRVAYKIRYVSDDGQSMPSRRAKRLPVLTSG
jgi:hypothetical protein